MNDQNKTSSEIAASETQNLIIQAQTQIEAVQNQIAILSKQSRLVRTSLASLHVLHPEPNWKADFKAMWSGATDVAQGLDSMSQQLMEAIQILNLIAAPNEKQDG